MFYPLRFEPILKHYLWGGDKLRTALGKQVPPDRTCAESWEICDRRVGAAEQSVVATGPLKGASLGSLVDAHPAELFGRHAPLAQFPLLIKLLDAREKLSVQVHPDDELAAATQPGERGKTEFWHVLEADPGAKIYAGLKPGIDRGAWEAAIRTGRAVECLHQIEPRAGDGVFLPAGMVHALGAGLLIVEIQQTSDATFRLFDWNRVGPDGRPRELHVEQGVAATGHHLGPGRLVDPQPTGVPGVARLIACDYFVVDRATSDRKTTAGGDDRAHVLIVVDGAVGIAGDPAERPLERGETILLPACLGAVEVTPRGEASWLDAYLP